MFKRLFITTTLILLPIVSVSAIVVEVPSGNGQQDVAVTGPTQITGDESSFFKLIETINQYLRFSIGLICMVVLVIGGFKLMTAQGSPDKMKQANKLLMGSLIGILIAILSFAIIRLVVNSFQ